MLIIKKYFFCLLAFVAIFSGVACSDEMDPTNTTTNLNMPITGDNLVGTWTATLGNNVAATLVISHSSNVINGASVSLSVSGSNFNLGNFGLYYQLTDNTNAVKPPRINIEWIPGAQVANILANNPYSFWINYLGDTASTSNVFTLLTNVKSNTYVVYPFIPFAMLSNVNNNQITMQAYFSYDLFSYDTSDATRATASRAAADAAVTKFTAEDNAIKEASLVTYTKQ